MAEKPDSVNTDMEQPRVGTEIRVLRSHWFRLNSETPACRIEREPGMSHAWRAVDPAEQRGLFVFVQHAVELDQRASCIIVITRVRRTVALARELKL